MEIKGNEMNKRVVTVFIMLIVISSIFFAVGCESASSDLKDGYYTAEDKNGSNGWYEYLTIYVNDDTIVSVEYNAKNLSGFIKSWDMNYMREMNALDGTYPNEYTRLYADQLIEHQNADSIDAISGATHSNHTFIELAKAVLKKAEAGDKTVALVDVQHEE